MIAVSTSPLGIKPTNTMVQNKQQSRRNYWDTCSSVCTFTRTAQQFSSDALLALHFYTWSRSKNTVFKNDPKRETRIYSFISSADGTRFGLASLTNSRSDSCKKQRSRGSSDVITDHFIVIFLLDDFLTFHRQKQRFSTFDKKLGTGGRTDTASCT